MSAETFKAAMTRFIDDNDFRKSAVENPNLVTEEFPKLTRAECEALRGVARVYSIDLTKVNAIFDKSDMQEPGTKGDVYCCCCCCCGAEGVVRHM